MIQHFLLCLTLIASGSLSAVETDWAPPHALQDVLTRLHQDLQYSQTYQRYLAPLQGGQREASLQALGDLLQAMERDKGDLLRSNLEVLLALQSGLSLIDDISESERDILRSKIHDILSGRAAPIARRCFSFSSS